MPRDGPPKYHVGYRKPPIESRFKLGASGNPNGRPKGRRNLKRSAQEVFTNLVLVREGERTNVSSKAVDENNGNALTLVNVIDFVFPDPCDWHSLCLS
jgi:hypothetical protein